MPLICLFGPDGSGKTTLVKILAKKFSDKGFNVRLSWMRGTHTLASLLARLLSKLTAFKGFANPYYGITIPNSLKRLWQLVEFSSTLPIILLKFILPSALGSWIIAERYTPDFVAWVSLTTSDQRYTESIEARFMLALSLKANVKIYVTATSKELSNRRKETNTIFINEQLRLYDRIASIIHAHKLDTTNESINDSLKHILSILQKLDLHNGIKL